MVEPPSSDPCKGCKDPGATTSTRLPMLAVETTKTPYTGQLAYDHTQCKWEAWGVARWHSLRGQEKRELKKKSF